MITSSKNAVISRFLDEAHMGGYKDFPKGDARRYFTVLVAICDLESQATLHYIAQHVGCTRAEAQRAIAGAVLQFGVGIRKTDGNPLYKITSWGVLDEKGVRRLIK